MINERSVGGMIDRFDADDLLDEFRIVMVDVLDQFGLGVCRTGNENELSVFHRVGDVVQEFLVFGGMSASDGIGLVMNMLYRIVWLDDDPIGFRRVEVENARFVMIDPDDRVGMGGHGNAAVLLSFAYHR